MENKDLKKCVIHDSVKCNKCVIVLSVLLNDVIDDSINAQHAIYRCSNHSLRNTIYTNMFNIAVDLVFRTCYKCGELFKMLTAKHKVKDIIMLDDVQGFCDIERCLDEEANGFIYDITTDAKYKKSNFMKLLIHDHQDR